MENKTTLLTIADRLNEVIIFIEQAKSEKPITVKVNNQKERQATTQDLLSFIENKVTFALCDLAELQETLLSIVSSDQEIE